MWKALRKQSFIEKPYEKTGTGSRQDKRCILLTWIDVYSVRY